MDIATVDVRTDSGENTVINNVAARMEIHVIRPTVYVQAVTASLDVLLLVSRNVFLSNFIFVTMCWTDAIRNVRTDFGGIYVTDNVTNTCDRTSGRRPPVSV